MEQKQVDVEALLARIDELESRNAIRDLVSDYCHGFDKRDFKRFLAIWWDDCVWDIGPPFGRFEGHEGIHRAIYEVLWPAWAETHHLTTNLCVTFEDSDNASSVCDVDCVGTLTDGPTCQIVGGSITSTLFQEPSCRHRRRTEFSCPSTAQIKSL